MATRAADTHQAGQAALATLVVRHFAAAWRRLDVTRLDATLPQLVQAVAALTASYGRSSGAMAAELYDVQRATAGIRGRFTVPIADPPTLEEIDTGVRWATKDLWSAEPDLAAARTMTESVAERAVLDTGRQTILDAVQADKRAKGWARTIEPGACSFCILLATRGAVYKGEDTADFRSHNACRCHAEPVFTAYETSAELRQWKRIYTDSTAGKSGKAARAAFRAAVEQHRGATQNA